MRALAIYLDTSVPSAYFDDRDVSRMLATREFWTRIGTHVVLVSDLVLREIRRIPDQARRQATESLLIDFRVVLMDDEMRAVAGRYTQTGVFGLSSAADALHVAAATVAGVDVLVSWNFQHLVKVRTVQRVNAANLDLGYRPIDIRSPLEL